jgi:outer membrane biosynthesis protein TonB
VTSSLATALALSLVLGNAPEAPPPPPPAAPPEVTPTPTTPAPTSPTTETPDPASPTDPTIPPPTTTTTPGAPKRVYMPGAKKDPVVMPTPVTPTPVKPTPVLPTGPTPILPGTDPNTEPDPGNATNNQPRARRPKRERRARNTGTDTGDDTGTCFAPQSRCRTFVITGTVLASAGVAIAAAGAVFVSRPMAPLREDPTTVKSFRPPGAVMLAVGGVALVSGIAVLASGLAGNRRDQSMRRKSAWWRPRVSVGVILP